MTGCVSACTSYDNTFAGGTASGPYSNKVISMTGTVTISSGNTLTLTGCNVNMGANAVIQINSGGTLVINKTNINSTCNNLWSKINNDGQITVQNGSVIMDSKDGIVNNTGSEFFITNSTFDKNFYSLQILNDDFSSSYVRGCVFKCSEGRINKLPSGYQGKQTLRQIYLVDVTDFTLGNSSNRNLIQNASTGVYVNYTSTFSGSSEINVIDNDFERVKTLYNYTATSKAIYGEININNTNNPLCSLTVDNNNTFKDWTNGIHAFRISKISEQENIFTNVTNGILNTTCGEIDVLSNDFLNCLYPIKCNNTPSISHLEINGNAVNLDAEYDKDNYSEEAIRIELMIRPNPTTFFHVKNNKINNCRIGIHDKSSDGVQIISNANGDNEYHTSIPKSDLMAFGTQKRHYGVWIESSKNVQVNNCVISWDVDETISSTQERNMLRGISITGRCTYGLVQENSITNMGAGIHMQGNSQNKKFKCNTIIDCYDGIHFDVNAKITNQGDVTGGISWANTWDISNQKMVGGLVSPATWLYNSTVSLENISSVNVLNLNKQACTNSDDCETPAPLMTCSEFTSYYYPVINDTLDYPEDDSALYVYYKFQDYYQMVKEDDSLLYSCTSLGSPYRTVYDSLKTKNIGLLGAALDSINSGNYTSALANLDTIITENTVEFNLWYSLRTYLIYYKDGVEPDSAAIDSLVIDSLYAIAIQDLFYGGEGVHIAQALLSLDQESDEEEESPRIANPWAQQENKIIEKTGSILFFPNPATSEVNVLIKGVFSSHQNFQLFNSLNQLCGEYLLPEGISHFRFSTSALQEGIYNWRIINDKIISETGKLVILK